MGIFNVHGTAEQKAWIEEANALVRFDPNVMLPGLKAETGKSQIDVYFRNLGSSIGGTASTDGVEELNTSLSKLAAQQIHVMEGYAHMTDFFYLTEAQRKAIYELWHPNGPDGHSWFEPSSYWNMVGEALMDLFVWGFTPWRTQSSFVHKPTEAIAAKLPAIYGAVKPPLPPPQPPPLGTFTELLLKIVKGLLEQFKAQAAATPGQWDDVLADVLLQIVTSLLDGKADIAAILAEAQARADR